MNVTITWEDAVVVDGSSDTDTTEILLSALQQVIPRETTPLVLELYGLDVDSGGATVAWHTVVRHLRDRHGHVVLVEAPQMLAHSLYKVGDLADGRIALVAPRSDEGITAN